MSFSYYTNTYSTSIKKYVRVTSNDISTASFCYFLFFDFVWRNLFTIIQFSIVLCCGIIKVRLKCKRKFKKVTWIWEKLKICFFICMNTVLTPCKMAKLTLKILRCEHCKIFKVCLAILKHALSGLNDILKFSNYSPISQPSVAFHIETSQKQPFADVQNSCS